MPNEESLGGGAVYLDDKDKVISFPSDMDEHDIGNSLRVSEYGQAPDASGAKYFLEAAKNPRSILGHLKDTVFTKVGLHKDRDAIGARAVIALNEIEQVRSSDLSDDDKHSELSAIYGDLDKYLASKGVYTRSTQDAQMYDYLLTVGSSALGYGALQKFGGWALTKGLLKFAAADQSLRRGVFPAIKYSYQPEDYEYKPISLSELLDIKTETPTLKTGADVIEMGLAGGITIFPKVLKQAKIDTVINEAMPALEKIFIEKGVKIPKEGMTPEFVYSQMKQSPTLTEVILQASDRLPIYRAFGNRGAVRLPSFNPGDKIKIGTEMAEVVKAEGEKITLNIGGTEVIKKISELPENKPKKEKPENSLYAEARKYKSAEEFIKAQGVTIFRGDIEKLIPINEYDVEKGVRDMGKDVGSAFSEGPGIYFTTGRNIAKGYAGGKEENITEIISHKKGKFLTPEDKNLSRREISNILSKVDKETMYYALSNWDENPIIAKNKMIDSIMESDGAIDQLMSIWADTFSHQNPQGFMDIMKSSGIDGLKIPRERTGHDYYVVYNRDILKTKSQLTDIWNKAQEGQSKEVKPVEEKPVDISEFAGTKQRSFVSSIQDEMPELKVAGQYIPRSTDKLATKARNLIKDDLPLAEKIARTQLDDNAVAIGTELLKHYTEEAAKLPEGAVKEALYEKAAELGNSMAERLTEAGRSVQAASILSRQTPEGQVRFAAKTIQKYNESVDKSKGILGIRGKKIPELTPEQVRDITESVKDISEMPEGEDKAIAWRDLQNYISDLVPTPLYRKIVTIWKAGLLTGIKTSGTNILSNFSHAFGTEVIKDIPAVAVDSVTALFTGKRTVAFTTEGIKTGTREGFQKGWRFLRTSYDERQPLEKYDYKRVSFGKGKFAKGLQKYEETIFNILGAEDQPFYYGAKARSLHDQAKAAAINKGLKGKEAKTFIDNLVENPTDEMLAYAVADAETAVFQNATVLSGAANKIKQIPAMEFIIPFSKTPSAVAMQIINYSPAGIAKTIFKTAGKGVFSEKQRIFSQGIGRALTGTGILALGAYLFRKGMITLDRPKSESEKKMWEIEGKKANSVKVGNKYRSIQVLGPAGNVLLIGAQLQNALNTSGSISEAAGKTLAGSAKSFTEQTYLTGVSSSIEAITEPDKNAERFASGLMASAVPTIVADIARATDPKMRRAETVAQKIIERIPILRKSLEPQIDVLGEERIVKENFLEIMADPTRPTTEIKEPVTKEIRRLIDSGNRVIITQVGDKDGYKILSQKQNTELWQRAGSVAYDKISTLMDIPAYSSVGDDVKAKKINEILDKAKLIARTEKVLEITQGLDGDELKAKLSEAKKSGLMNREVFELYIRMR